MVPVWYIAARTVQKTLQAKQIPLLSLSAAFTFVIMMFNIPIPGGSTGHMTGGVIATMLVGPWAALIALSLTLTIQALLFGDGGITTLGANCFNLALITPVSGYYAYHAIAAGAPGPRRQWLALAIAGYIAINLTALAAAVELGVQPMIAHSPDGRPLYAPYPLSVTIPAMGLSHLLIFGPIEALGTAMTISYVLKTNEIVLYKPASNPLRPLWIGLLILIILTPIGLIAQGFGWGEWPPEELGRILGYVPQGMQGLKSLWNSALSGYNIPGFNGPLHSALGYIISAALGSGLIVLIIYIAGRIWKR